MRMPAIIVLLLVLAAPAAAGGGDADGISGAALYADACAACHLEAGEGLAGFYPPLAGNALVLGDAAELIDMLLRGRGGMPGYAGQLSDSDLAAVITFIRASWGNAAPAVTSEQVGRIAEAVGREPPPSR